MDMDTRGSRMGAAEGLGLARSVTVSEQLFSPSWYRVAQLRPVLRSQVRWFRHCYRQQAWHLTQDLSTGQFLRLNQQAYALLALLDGHRTVEEAWQLSQQRGGDDAPTQQEVIQLLNQLHQAHLIAFDRMPDVEGSHRQARELRMKKLRLYLSNPMAVKVPLLNPDRWLHRHVDLLPRQVWQWLPWLWLAFMATSLVQLGMHWDSLTQSLAAAVFTPESLLMLWLVFPLTKLVHEWGHGLAVKALGGRCREMGLMFLVLVPVPYVDASDSSSLSSKWLRILVGGAGMMAELTLAGIALWLWPVVSPGPLQGLLHLVIVVAGISTIVFNANPLLRFDGYYMLSDVLEIPNLAPRSNLLWLHLLKSRLLGLTEDRPPATVAGERPWLWAYAPASLLYRTMVTLGIIWLVAQHYFFVGVVLALWVTWGFVGLPILRAARYLGRETALQGRRLRAASVFVTAGATLALAAALVPLPNSTVVEGVIWLPEQSRVRAPVTCFGHQMLVSPGQPVTAGQALMSCNEPQLDAQLAEAQARLGELRTRFERAESRDRVEWAVAREQLEHQKRVVASLQRRSGELVMLSPHDGEFNMSAVSDFKGRHVERGELIAHVLEPSRYSLLTVVPQADVDQVRQHTRGVELRTADRIMELIRARVVREVPAATQDLPSYALSLQGGGQIGLDPRSSRSVNDQPSSSGAKALSPLFQFELAFDEGQHPRFLGSRVHVKFLHPDAPLAQQVYRAVRQAFMRRFSL